ncbi:MAG: GTPase HflX [Armatimonadetes bacterium]|nr:GTPase HflX [Armatimonadota bacterium]
MPKNTHDLEQPKERAFLVFVNQDENEDAYVEEELAGLCEAAGVEVCGFLRQRLDRPTTATYLGKGKVQELAAHVVDTRADVVVFDCELSAIQARNLQDQMRRPTVDRTQLILDIFATRARTREGQLQVELAQLSYMMPRLMSVYTKFERQKGGIGMRGPGETKLESDRRMVRDRIAKLKDDIEEVKKHREHQRASRRKYPFPFAAICGYTSAGKSTLMNRLSGTDLLADAMPFATLDPTTRKVDLPEGYSLFLTDTVGFIRNLPTHLVAAFRSTLEEVTSADIVLHVVDASVPEWDVQRDAVMETLRELNALDKPTITVFNKVDRLTDAERVELERSCDRFAPAVLISATNGFGVEAMLEKIKDIVQDFLGFVCALVPYSESKLVDECYQFGRVIKVDYRDDGIYLEAELVKEMRGMLRDYLIEGSVLSIDSAQ